MHYAIGEFLREYFVLMWIVAAIVVLILKKMDAGKEEADKAKKESADNDAQRGPFYPRTSHQQRYDADVSSSDEPPRRAHTKSAKDRDLFDASDDVILSNEPDSKPF